MFFKNFAKFAGKHQYRCLLVLHATNVFSFEFCETNSASAISWMQVVFLYFETEWVQVFALYLHASVAFGKENKHSEAAKISQHIINRTQSI